MKKIFTNAEQIVTVNTNGKNYKRGDSLSEIHFLTEHSILVDKGKILDFIPNQSLHKVSGYQEINLGGKIILPGLIECHTHSVFSGSRSNEFREKLNGKSYEEISKSGGGINHTVRSVRETSINQLLSQAKSRIEYFISQGITTLEIKSGYGLDFNNEIKILEVIKALNNIFPIDIVPTFLGAHTIPLEYSNRRAEYISSVTTQMIPYIAKNKLAEFCDCFCEITAFSADETDEIFTSAIKHGLNIKLHTDQFNSIGGINTAIKNNSVSIDHLEAIKAEDILRVAGSETVCVLLPGSSFFLNREYAPARKLIESNAIIAISTDFNPGSSNIADLNLIMSIAAIKMGMTIEEVISAVTINPAKALNRNLKGGSLEINKDADFAIFNAEDYAEIVYSVGKNLNVMTVKNGNIIYNSYIN